MKHHGSKIIDKRLIICIIIITKERAENEKSYV
jgi:hypothetical protein